MEPDHCSRAGEPRKAPDGSPLPGKYRVTSWTLSFDNLDNAPIGPMTEKAVQKLPVENELWSKLKEEGGEVWFILAIVGTKYQGAELSAELMAQLADMGIGLGIEIYAVPQND